jgi:hypothetical protein
MLIGLLSDTHIAWPEQTFPRQIMDVFQGVDLILHAGDIWIPWVLDQLESVAPVLAARGDDDLESDIGDDSRIAKRQILTLEGLTIWMTHIKPRYSLIRPGETLYNSLFNQQVQDPEDPPDVIVFGHTHFAEIENYKGALLVNPGSPTLPTYLPKLGTVGLLTVESGQVEARIVQLE